MGRKARRTLQKRQEAVRKASGGAIAAWRAADGMAVHGTHGTEEATAARDEASDDPARQRHRGFENAQA